MTTMRKTMAALAVLLAVAAAHAGNNGQPRRTTVYMFGFAASMTDSLCVLTEVQPVEVFVLPNGFLADRSLYSLQLNNHLAATREDGALTCAVFYDKNRNRAAKHFQKVRRRYADNPMLNLRVAGSDEFRFETEDWTEPEAATEAAPKKDEKNRKTKKKKQ